MQFDCFLTHDWGEDEGGRNNHARVARVCANLKKEGLRPWFDEERMRGDINDKMADGIEGSGCVVCFITKRYIQKAGGKGPNGANDNCKYEFDYALRRKGVEKMIVVVMEQGCRNTNEWTGAVGGKLGGTLYIDLSSDDVATFDARVKQLSAEIRAVVGSADIDDDKINDELSAASTTSCKSQGEEAAAALRELSLGSSTSKEISDEVSNGSVQDIGSTKEELRFTQVALGDGITYLLRSNGTVLRKEGSDFTDIIPKPGTSYVHIECGVGATYFVRSDGTAVRKSGSKFTEYPPAVGTKYIQVGCRKDCITYFLRDDGMIVRKDGDEFSDVAPKSGTSYVQVVCRKNAYFVRSDGAVVRSHDLKEYHPEAGTRYVHLACGVNYLWLLRDDGKAGHLSSSGVFKEHKPPDGLSYVHISVSSDALYLIDSEGDAERVKSSSKWYYPAAGTKYIYVARSYDVTYLLRDDGVAVRKHLATFTEIKP